MKSIIRMTNSVNSTTRASISSVFLSNPDGILTVTVRVLFGGNGGSSDKILSILINIIKINK